MNQHIETLKDILPIFQSDHQAIAALTAAIADMEKFQRAQAEMIKFLIPWSRHMDESWIEALMESHDITQDGCGFFIPKGTISAAMKGAKQ